MSIVFAVILSILLLGLAICLIAIVICDIGIERCEKRIKECENIRWYLENGTPMEEILKMPMPKELRKGLREIYERDNEITNENISNNF